MHANPALASTAFLMADPARAAMLMALLDGAARPAGELAYAAGVTAQTASTHLAKLREGGLLQVEAQGRHRYYRLAGPQVAAALESLAALTPAEPVRQRPRGKEAQDLRFARCCYDHLAGQLGVAVARGMQARGLMVAADGKQFTVTAAGQAWLTGLGMDTSGLKPGCQGQARQCLDWTEREHHLSGPLGVRLMRLLCDKGWLRRTKGSRAVQVTPAGWTGLRAELGVDPQSFQ